MIFDICHKKFPIKSVMFVEDDKANIFDPGLSEGVICHHPCLWSVSWPVFKYLRDCLLVFSNFCMKLGHHKGTKVTEPFLKKNLGGSHMGEKPHFWGIFDFLSISMHPIIKIF